MRIRRSYKTGSGAWDFTWPAIAICAIFLGLAIAYSFRGAQTRGVAVDQINQLLAWRFRPAEPEPRQALVITANRRAQLVVVATLSPRGFDPLLASSEPEVLSQIRSHPGTLKLAVVDATLPDYAFIARALKDTFPVGSIIVLKSSRRSQEIGPMLLDRL